MSEIPRKKIAVIKSSIGFRFVYQIKSGKRDSNPRPLAWEANALPTELLPRELTMQRYYINIKTTVVGRKISKKRLWIRGFLCVLPALFLLYAAPLVNNRGVRIDIWSFRATATGLISTRFRSRIITSGRLVNERGCIVGINFNQAFAFKILSR